MPDSHRIQASFRIPKELRTAALDLLKDQEERPEPWTLNDIVIAAFAEYVKRPRTREKQLEAFKPPRKRGRPRKER